MIPFLLTIQDENLRNRLEEIYIRYKKDAYWIAVKILHDKFEAEDVVHEAIIKISSIIEKDEGLDCNKIKGLIVIIVRNLSINIYNRRKKIVTSTYDGSFENLADNLNLNEEIIQLEQAKLIADLLAEINPTYADIITLKYYHEYSNSEISQLLNISEGNVRTRLLRARLAIKKILEQEVDILESKL